MSPLCLGIHVHIYIHMHIAKINEKRGYKFKRE